jgi:hypothetical protein
MTEKPAEIMFDLNGKKLPLAEYQVEFEKLAAAAREPITTAEPTPEKPKPTK